MRKPDIQADKKTAAWLKANGISDKQLANDELWLLQSQKNASWLLKHHIDKLTNAEQSKLMDFAYLMFNAKQRKTITKRMSYEVLNITKKIKRHQFKTQRQA
jgi:orotate phosphoribosyltransferase-like protein